MGIWLTNRRAAFVVAIVMAGGSLGGCGSMIADLPVVGLPAAAPARSKEPRSFMPVNDVPRDRDGTMTSIERQQIQADLVAARARSAAAAAAK